MPSPLTVTLVPVCQAPPSRRYSVDLTPERSSLALKLTATGALCQAPSAPDWVVTGGTVSILTCTLLVASTLPALSVER